MGNTELTFIAKKKEHFVMIHCNNTNSVLVKAKEYYDYKQVVLTDKKYICNILNNEGLATIKTS